MKKYSQTQHCKFSSCPKKYFFSYGVGIEKHQKTNYILKGSMFHGSLKEWHTSYNESKALSVITQTMVDEGTNHPLNQKINEELVKETTLLCGGYFKAYPKSDNFIFHLVEQKFKINVDGIVVSFIPDSLGLILVNGKHHQMIVEQKSASRIDKNYWNRIKMDFQTHLYIGLLQYFYQDYHPKILYRISKFGQIRQKKNESDEDFLKRKAEDYLINKEKLFLQEIVDSDQRIVDQCVNELRFAIQSIRSRIGRCNECKKYNSMATFESCIFCGVWYRNTGSCDKYGGCEYHPLCLKGTEDLQRLYSQDMNKSILRG
jgi:hypothetical protein